MSSTQEVSSVATSSGKKGKQIRRSWTFPEEQTLIVALKEMQGSRWKAENGFKVGYLMALEQALLEKHPNTDLRGNPQIISKISAWKKLYGSLCAMLNRSGVGFNDRGNHMIECEDDQWEQIVKADPSARVMRYKSYPLYEDWKVIWGKDRPNGDNAEDAYEAFVEMQKDDEHNQETGGNDEREFSFENDPLESAMELSSESARKDFIGKKTSKTKRSKVNSELQGVCEMLADMNEATNARLDKLADRLGYDYDAGKARQETYQQLGNIPGISTKDRIIVCELIAFKLERLDIWRGMNPDERAIYVQHLLETRP